jgi:hypothetical protein
MPSGIYSRTLTSSSALRGEFIPDAVVECSIIDSRTGKISGSQGQFTGTNSLKMSLSKGTVSRAQARLTSSTKWCFCHRLLVLRF